MNEQLWGHKISELVNAGLVAAGIFFILLVARKTLRSWLTPKAGEVRPLREAIHDKLREVRPWFLLLLALYLASRGLSFGPRAELIWGRIFTFGLILQLGLIADSFITRERLARFRPRTHVNPVALNLLVFILKFVLWVLVLLLVLDNLGVQITALVTGLGIGGVAIALAVQNVLGDLLGSLTIALDKPFEEGDAIAVGDFNGTVERVGIKTTRLRSVNGEELIFPNGDLLQSRIRNFRRMNERRALFTFGIVYETDPAKLLRVNEIVKRLVESQPHARFDRCHFKALAAYSLDYEVVYWLKTPDYTAFMDTQQAINVGLFEAFAKEGIEFAYPTQMQVQRDPNPRLG